MYCAVEYDINGCFRVLVNVIAALFGLFSLYLSLKPRDDNHPYGHGKIEFFSEAVEGILIMVAGVAILSKYML